MTPEELISAAHHPNVQAFQRVIRQGESSQDDSAYRRRFHPTKVVYFDSFASHPRIFEPIPWRPGQKSSAAGAYQITATTFDNVHRAFPWLPTDFSPPTQDLYCVALLQMIGALALVVAGQLDAAIAKCRSTWTSLPGAEENSGRYTLVKAHAIYAQYGGGTTKPSVGRTGTVSTGLPPTTTTEVPMPTTSPSLGTAIAGVGSMFGPIGGIVGAVAGSLIDAFTPLGREKTQKELGRHDIPPEVANQVYDNLIDNAKKLTGTVVPPDAPDIVQAKAIIDAGAAAQANPEIMAKLEAQTLDHLDKVAPMLDKLAQYDQARWVAEQAGRDAAQARSLKDRWDMTPTLVYFAAASSTIIDVALLGALIWAFVTNQNIALITGLLGLAGPMLQGSKKVWTEVFAYRFDGTKESAATNATLAEIAASRPTPQAG